jgi:hypothetical protein
MWPVACTMRVGLQPALNSILYQESCPNLGFVLSHLSQTCNGSGDKHIILHLELSNVVVDTLPVKNPTLSSFLILPSSKYSGRHGAPPQAISVI